MKSQDSDCIGIVSDIIVSDMIVSDIIVSDIILTAVNMNNIWMLIWSDITIQGVS